MEKGTSDIQLVITVALKKEILKDWFESRGIAVHTLAALKSGTLKQQTGLKTGVLIVITGVGLKASEEAACWIRDNIKPLFVLNLGTCGITDKRRSTGKWHIPVYVSNENGERLELDSRLPVPFPDDVINIQSLISVRKACTGNLPDSLKKHDAIDMECYSQARVFRDTDISFHCLKFSTDYSDSNTSSDFNRNLELFIETVKKLFGFAEPNLNNIKITTVMPVYNRKHTINRALDSVLSQSCKPEEIIVVNDCSTDGTRDILDSYEDKITVIHLPQNSGPSKARNEGIKRAHTEWIAFLDSDDCWEKDKLKDQVEYLGRYPFYEILQSEEIWIRNGRRVNPCKHHKKSAGWIWEQSLERCLISPSGVLVKKSLLERYGCFDESLPVCEDYDLWLKISRYHPVGLEPVLSVIKYGGHEDQLSHKYPAMDRFRVNSLVNLLRKESMPYFRQKLIDMLTKKLTILITGYDKRDNSKDALECRKLLDALKEYQ